MQLSDINLVDPDAFVEGVPHDQFTLLRHEAPVFWHEDEHGGFWALTKHDDVVHANRDAKTFSSYARSALYNVETEEQLAGVRLMMLNLDPPDHTKLRKIVNRGFTPRRIKELQQSLVDRSREIVDDIAEAGACDFVTEVACELPLQAIADLIGIPQEDRHKVFDWSNRLIGFEDPEFGNTEEEAGAAAVELYAYAQELAEDRRKNPRDDIITNLLDANIDGDALDDMEFNMFFMLLAVAGNETTRNAISHSMLALMQHPEQRQLMLDDPSLIDSAIEEFLRWATPVMHFKRTALVDVEMRGQKIKAGDRVMMWYSSANRDEEVFEDPFAFNVKRDPNLHTLHSAFGGGGPHFCLGANLARMEMKLIFDELLRRIPDMQLASEPSRLRSNFINGLKHMDVTFTPVARSNG
ncbi:MAG: cytochrome P450 [Actinobacteria bacterium]|nr:cytochrome P450 [Actinomycetota bacterium]